MPTSARWKPTNSPQISVKPACTARAFVVTLCTLSARSIKKFAPSAHTQMACHFHGSVFCHLPAWKLLSMRALSPRRRRWSSALQRDSRVLAAAFCYGLILWHRGTVRSASSASFCILFLTSQTEPNCKPAKRLQFGEDEQRNGRDLPLAAGRGMWSL